MMKKTIAALLAALLMLSLAACGNAVPVSTDAPETASAAPTAEIATEPTEPATQETTEPTTEPTQSAETPADADALKGLLDEIGTDVRPGTAGSSLVATRCAAKLMSWGVATELTKEEIRAAVVEWMTDKGNDALVEFLGQLTSVNEACVRLLAEDVTDMLDEAGCADIERTWGSEPVEAVVTVMDIVGVES